MNVYTKAPFYFVYLVEVFLNILVDVRPLDAFFTERNYGKTVKNGETIDQTYLDFWQIIRFRFPNISMETHQVPTEDGYINTAFRIYKDSPKILDLRGPN